jgi:hypothetical protein
MSALIEVAAAAGMTHRQHVSDSDRRESSRFGKWIREYANGNDETADRCGWKAFA